MEFNGFSSFDMFLCHLFGSLEIYKTSPRRAFSLVIPSIMMIFLNNGREKWGEWNKPPAPPQQMNEACRDEARYKVYMLYLAPGECAWKKLAESLFLCQLVLLMCVLGGWYAVTLYIHSQ